MKYLVIVLTVALLTAGCKDDSVVNPGNENQGNNNNLIKTQVDLQNGFAGKIAYISVNDERVYYSILSDLVSLAGPDASFTTYLPEGESSIVVRVQIPNSLTEFVVDSCRVSLKKKDKYFIGLQLSDSLRCIVQDSTFFYL